MGEAAGSRGVSSLSLLETSWVRGQSIIVPGVRCPGVRCYLASLLVTVLELAPRAPAIKALVATLLYSGSLGR